MSMKSPFPEKSLFLAPMEGITDEIFRHTIHESFPGWDYYACDFLRIPSSGILTKKFILQHYGVRTYENQELRKKTLFQILVSERSVLKPSLQQIIDLGFEWLDLNLGCPSRKVNAHKGGSYLLSDLKLLEKIVRSIRTQFPHTFTAKIRVGYKDDTLFDDIIKLLNNEGVDAITIHGRTRDQVYKGIANWDYIGRAVEISGVPIVGNGDVWTYEDLQKIYNETGCHSIMMARGALKTPWFALKPSDSRAELITKYYRDFAEQMLNNGTSEVVILKRLKSVSRFLFDEFENGEDIKRNFMRSSSIEQFMSNKFI